MAAKGHWFTVVENAGYEGECDMRTAFSTSEGAWKWARRHYRAGEIEALHVAVARDTSDGRTYEY